jgi:hypothetical protein
VSEAIAMMLKVELEELILFDGDAVADANSNQAAFRTIIQRWSVSLRWLVYFSAVRPHHNHNTTICMRMDLDLRN